MKRFFYSSTTLRTFGVLLILGLLILPSLLLGQDQPKENPHRQRALELVVGAWQVMSVVESKASAQNSSLELLEEALRLLRHPQENGGFLYARLSAKENGDVSRSLRVRGTKRKPGKPLVASATEVFRFGLFVDKSAGLFRDNNPVYVKSVILQFRNHSEQWETLDFKVNHWVPVGQSWYQDLPVPAAEARAEVITWCETPTLKKTFIDLIWARATLEDLPENPDAELIEKLKIAIKAARSPYLDRYYTALKPLYEEASAP